MDEIVRRAMAKWPNVPAVFGWLALDRRGYWLLQRERISNSLLIEFISRNYGHDDAGRWFFQNGPQRVFVSLAYVPWVLRIAETGALITHTTQPVRRLKSGWVDQEGVVLFDTEHGAGAMDERDVEALSLRFSNANGTEPGEDALLDSLERLQAGEETGLLLPYADQTITLRPIRSTDVPARFGFVADPQPAAGEAPAY